MSCESIQLRAWQITDLNQVHVVKTVDLIIYLEERGVQCPNIIDAKQLEGKEIRGV